MIYKDIPGYEGLYKVSDFGVVLSVHRVVPHSYAIKMTIREIIMKQRIDRDGYPVLRLSKCGKKKAHHCHRLVAKAFIPNPDNLPQVNHKDGNKKNNHVSNLEWCTAQYNVKHAFDNGLKFPSEYSKNGPMLGRFGKDHNLSRAVLQLTMDGIMVRKFDAIVEAKKLGFQPTHIIACCKGRIKHHRNFKWKYVSGS